MPYVTSVERIGIRKGHREGRLEGEQKEAKQLLHRLLNRRFGAALPEWVEAKLEQADTATLEEWAERVLFAGDLEAVFKEE
jgi:Domain of unknown function (DUF4351)